MAGIKNRVYRIFEKAGVFLVDLWKLDQPEKGKTGMYQELLSLSLGKKTAVRNYYIKKISLMLMVLAAGSLISVISLFAYCTSQHHERTESLERPGYGEGDRKESLTVKVEGEEEVKKLEVTVQERKYTDQEKEKMLDEALLELEKILPGNNESLDEVRSDLVLPASMKEGAVKISWLTVPYGIIDESGKLKGSEDENGTLVEIQGTLTCGGREAVYNRTVKVFPPLLPEKERFYHSVEKAVEMADVKDSSKDKIALPQNVDGKALIWSRPSENPILPLLVLTLIFSVCIYFEMDSKVHQKAEERKNQLMIDYPDLMWKMTMLLGAGLSTKGTFSRISEEYLRKRPDFSSKGRKSQKQIRYVYEEVAYTCFEMKNGISESQAYERFGKRCQLPEYIRLGSVLSQNLKKGSKGLTELLESEAASSMNERKNHAKKIGEQAGTKLLLPMVMMLGIVLVILMVPAFLSF